MKITKEHVGKKVRRDSWDADQFVVVIAVGNWMFIASRKDEVRGEECFTDLKGDWELYEEPKQYKIVSPAVICEQSYQITTQVYETEEKARLEWPTSFHSWPACEANGNPIQYRVEVKE